MTFCFGIDTLLASTELRQQLARREIGLVAHPASITSGHAHTLDALMAAGISIKRAFGPQHGMRGDKQDNMIESEDYRDPTHAIPVLSLYGEHRYPTPEMLAGLDLVLFDLQDVGCRIYTYITTLLYFLQACDAAAVELWVLDRPNPAGRPIDGLQLETGQESFVGCAPIPTRHGLTVGELAHWLVDHYQLGTQLNVIAMTDYHPNQAPGLGWPLHERPWVNPSPNASSLNMSRCFAGTVLLEGTNLSEGRGTTVPLEVIGAPDFPTNDVLAYMRQAKPQWLSGAYLRPCFFSPTFHKYQGELCAGLQIHTDTSDYAHDSFQPFRLIAGLLKSLRLVRPDYDLWRHHDYEYEIGRIPIDVINGGPALRQWVDDPTVDFDFLDARLTQDCNHWAAARQPYLRY